MTTKLFFSIVFLMIVSLGTLMAQNYPVVAPTGSTVNFVPKFTTTGADPTVISNSLLYESSTTVGATNFYKIEQNTPYGNFLGYQAGNSNSGSSNVGLGYQALYTNTSGQKNTATGVLSLKSNSTGQYNTANGYGALNANTASENTAVGWAALLVNTSGANNTAIGSGILYNSTTGDNNTAAGYRALFSNVAGSNATAIGYSAMYYTNSTATPFTNYNVAVGYEALRGSTTAANNTGNYNTTMGYQSLYSNTTGNYNTVVGWKALYTNTTEPHNTAIGYSALYTNSNGKDNTAIGSNALYTTNTSANTAVGMNALYSNTTGSDNTALGYAAGYTNTACVTSTFIGRSADANGNYTNTTAIGYNASSNATYKIVLGTSANNNTGGYSNWQNFSDGRFKNNVLEDVPGLSFITKLRPITYTLNAQQVDEFLGIKQRMDTIQDVTAQNRYYQRLNEISLERKTGFIAQEVDSLAQLIGYIFDGVHTPENDKDNYSISYASFVVPLVKAVQEQQKMIDTLNSTVALLQAQVNTLTGAGLRNKNNNDELMNSSNIRDIELANNAILYQNAPNPFSEGTTIKYFVPENADAQIIFMDEFGSHIKEFKIEAKGIGLLNVSASNLVAGMYSYSLIVNGRVVDTKKMIKQ